MFQDREGSYWICNSKYRYRMEDPDAAGKVEERDGNRLLRYKREPGIQGLKTPDGQDHIYFFGMVQDAQGDLWMVTYDDGIFRYDGKTVSRYPVQDSGKDYTTYSVLLDRSGNIWVGTHEGGLFRFDGKDFRRVRMD
ncbi:MAG: two-component regulator propeller domain-containing protein [Bacteroidia bacterium]